MAQHYFSVDYFSTDYFSADYWATEIGAGVFSGQINATVTFGVNSTYFWSDGYWSTGYWSTSWWPGSQSFGKGTFDVSGTVFGSITSSINWSSAFTGPVVQVDLFDVAVTFGTPWVATEYAAWTGTVAPTLAGVSTATWQGTFTAVGAIIGPIAATLEDATSAVPGTFVSPGVFTGGIASTLQDHAPALTGAVLDPDSTFGQIPAVLDPATSLFTGEFTAQLFTGSIAATLEDTTTGTVGAFYPAGALVFQWVSRLDGVGCLMEGTSAYLSNILASVRGDVSIKTNRVGSGGKRTRVSGKGRYRA